MGFNQSQLHVSRPLTDLVVSYDPNQDGFIRSKFFPRKPVGNLANQIRQISKGDLLRLYDGKVGADGRVHEVQFRLDTTLTYSCIPYAFQAVLDNLEAQNADGELQYEQRQAMAANAALQNSLEYVAVKQILRDTAVMTNNTTLSGGTLWDNYSSATSQPLDDMIAACQLVRMRTGKNVNNISMSEITWNVLAQHPNVLSRMPVHTTGPTGAILTVKILEDVLRVDPGSINVTTATYNSAKQGETAAYKSYIGSDVLVARTENPSLSDFGLGHEFAFSGFGSDPVAVFKYPDNLRGALGADIIKVVSMVDFKVLNADAGYLIKTTLDTTKTAYGSFVD